MGESLLAILFEGGTILLLPASQVSLGRLYCGALFGVALSFSFKVFYTDIDNQVLRRGTHAIRWNRNAGLVWSLCHFFFHAALILAATGLGLALRGAAVRPSVEAAAAASAPLAATVGTSGRAAVAAAAVAAAPVAGVGASPAAAAEATAAAAKALLGAFDTISRWVFTAGTFGALLVLVTLSLAHKPGPRAATRTARLATRTAVSVAALVGLPFVPERSLGGLGLLGVVASLVATMALIEYVLLECDRIGWFRSELSVGASSGDIHGGGGAGEEEEDWEVGAMHPAVTTGTAGVDGGAAGRFTGKADDADVENYYDDDDVEGGLRAGGGGDWSDGEGNTRAAGEDGPPAAAVDESEVEAAAAASRVPVLGAPASVDVAAGDAAVDDDGGDAEEQPALHTARRRARCWAGEDGTLTVSGVRYKTYDAAGGKGGCQPATFF